VIELELLEMEFWDLLDNRKSLFPLLFPSLLEDNGRYLEMFLFFEEEP
jgi:hypothetical protein